MIFLWFRSSQSAGNVRSYLKRKMGRLYESSLAQQLAQGCTERHWQRRYEGPLATPETAYKKSPARAANLDFRLIFLAILKVCLKLATGFHREFVIGSMHLGSLYSYLECLSKIFQQIFSPTRKVADVWMEQFSWETNRP